MRIVQAVTIAILILSMLIAIEATHNMDTKRIKEPVGILKRMHTPGLELTGPTGRQYINQ